MRAGKLRHVVIVEQPQEARDAFGQAIETWVTFATVYAEMRPIAGRELLTGGQLRAETRLLCRIRYLEGLTEKMRISLGGLYYNILSIADLDLKHAWMELQLSEGLRDG